MQVLLHPQGPVSHDHPVYASLSADSGINPILPYIVAAIKRGSDERAALDDLPRGWRLLWAAAALVRNHDNSLSAQLPQLLPALLSLLVTKRIGRLGACSPCVCVVALGRGIRKRKWGTQKVVYERVCMQERTTGHLEWPQPSVSLTWPSVFPRLSYRSEHASQGSAGRSLKRHNRRTPPLVTTFPDVLAQPWGCKLWECSSCA